MPAGSQITIPTTPAAPRSVEFIVNDAAAVVISPFTGAQQVQYWGTLPMELSVTWPAMTEAQIGAWITFLRALKGQANYFQFGSAFTAAYTAALGSRYWRLKENRRKWSLGDQRVYGIQFDVREAL